MSANYFNSIFGNTSVNDNGMYGMLGSSNGALGEYAMIRSGAYKKLLNAYYKKPNVSGSKDEATATEDKKENTKLATAKTSAETLRDAAAALNDISLFESTGKKDEEGKDIFDREKIKDTVKSFVSAYNSFIDSTSEVDDKKILRKSLSIVKETAANQNLLKKAGITIGEGNKLSIDEKKLDSVHMSTLTSLFTGRNSLGDDIAQKAGETYRLAYSATYNKSNACSYTYSGNYSYMGSSSSIMDKFL